MQISWLTYTAIQFIWTFIGLIAFLWLLFRETAPYGRHIRQGYGITINNRLGWVLMETPVMIWLLLFFQMSGNDDGQSGIVYLFIGLFLLHYIHRSFIFPVFLRTKGKFMPLAIVLMALLFNMVNGFGLGYYFGHFADYPNDWHSSWQFILGIGLFFCGICINIYSDYRLIGLRKQGDTSYHIPRGGLFEYISCPNLMGELIEWGGFALMTWCLPGFVFWFWSMANLVPRALAHHRWYHQHFADYPKQRKAVIPFLL